ncbi:MAG TPA: hypothetical protein VEL05_08140, partial [Candidatus Acidoferrum sp.]|nr:hypothetical protein [Candidatus Acidoferrum sp.]
MGDLVSGCLAPETVQRFVSGTLDAGAVERIEQHVDSCVECRTLVAALARAEATAPTAATRLDVIGLESTAAIGPESAPTAVDLAAPRRAAAKARSAGHPAVGTRIDRYVIERPLGAGGMGAVSLADDPEL